MFADQFVTDQDPSSEFERAGVWRRLAAFLIDLLLASVVLQVCALVLFPLTHGGVQFAGGVYAIKCSKLDAAPAGVVVPPNFDANVIIDCQNRLFGLLSARTLRVQRLTRDGAITKEVHVDSMLDADGVPITGLSLGILLLPLLLAWRFALDDRWSTPGRRICGIRLAYVAGGGAPAARDLRRRYLLLVAILSPLIIWPFVSSFFPVMSLPENLLIGITLASDCPALILALAAWRQVYVRRDTWYDRFAGTSVIRTERPKVQSETASDLVAPSDANIDGSPRETLSILPLLPAPLPREPGRGRRSYIARHWQGELPLPLSYWVNGTLLGIIAGVAIATLSALMVEEGFDARPGAALLAICAIWLFVWLFVLWQTVGVWRSATRYGVNEKSAWGHVAKVMVALGAAATLWQFCSAGLPQIGGMVDILTGDNALGPHHFKILAYGEMLEFSGGIKFGVASELQGFLDAMPDVKTVRLDSHGGRIREAQKMSDIIKARGLSTLVETECLSACTIAFMGGRDRAILSNARLGFHQPFYQGITASGLQHAIAEEEERLQKLGLSRAFAERANQAKPASMWFPDNRELVNEHVVTRVVRAVAQRPSPPVDDTESTRAAADSDAGTESVPQAAAPSRPPAPAVSIPQDLFERLRSSQGVARPPSSITGIK